MTDEGRRCALPGCDKVIRAAEGRPERRYCTAAHRAAARQARRAAMQPGRHGGSPSVAPAETLPWLREAAEEHAVAEPPVPTGPVLRPSSRGEAAEPGAVARAAARRSRNAGREIPRTRRRRTLAMIGVAGILAGGYAATARPDTPASTAPSQTVPEEESADAWAQHAAVALASVNRQLDTLAQTEDEWRQLPASRQGDVPAPVAALEERRSELQRRRATLQSQLDAYRSLRETQKDLAASEQHLQVVEEAIADAPQPRSSTGQEAALVALDEQRDLRLRQRDAQRAQLRTLEQGVSSATRTPLPDDDETTTKINRDAQDVVRNGGRAPERPDDPKPPRPDVVSGREQDEGKPRQETGTSGPPDPRGPRDESGERRAEAGRRAGAQDPTSGAHVDAQVQRGQVGAGGAEEEGHAAAGPGGAGPAPGPGGVASAPGPGGAGPAGAGAGSATAGSGAVPTPGGPTATVTAPSGPTASRPTPPGPTTSRPVPHGAGPAAPAPPAAPERHGGMSHGPARAGVPGPHEEKRPGAGAAPGAGTTPGKTAPESAAPGKTAPESAAPGKTAPESAAPGKTAPESAAPGKTVPPSRTVPGRPAEGAAPGTPRDGRSGPAADGSRAADRQADGPGRATVPGNGGSSRASTRAPSERAPSERAPSERGASHGPSTRDRSGAAARDGGAPERPSGDDGVTRIVVPVVPDTGTGAAQADPTASGGRPTTPPADAGAGHRSDGDRSDKDRAGDGSRSGQNRSGDTRATPSAQHDDDGIEDQNANRGSTRRSDGHATTRSGRAGTDSAGRKGSSGDGSDDAEKTSRSDSEKSRSDSEKDSDKGGSDAGSKKDESRSGTDKGENKDDDEARPGSDEGGSRSDSDKDGSDSKKDKPDSDKDKRDSDKDKSGSDKDKSGSDKDRSDSEKGDSDSGKHKSGSDQENSGSDEKDSGSAKDKSHEDDSAKSRSRSGDSGGHASPKDDSDDD